MEAGVQTLQKKEAADARLAEAVRLLEEAKKVTKETVHRPPEEGVLEIESTPHADVQELIETIQMGDSDEATKRLSRIFKLQEEKILAFHRRNQEISEGQAIINSFNSSPQNGGFSDIVEDPFLLRMANGFIDERLRKGEQNSWALYESVGKEVREWKEKTISKPEKEEEIKITDDLAKRRDKKKKIDSIESASQKAILAEEDTEKSYSEAIAEMQAERGKIKEI